MNSYDPIQELSSSPYPELSMPAVTSPMLAYSPPKPQLPGMRGEGWDLRQIPGSGVWSYTHGFTHSTNHIGYLFEDFKKDFYDRIHFTPGQLNLGNVLSVQTERISVWNAYFSSKDLTDYQEPSGEGVDVDEPVSPLYEIPPLHELFYDVSISASGPPQFSEQITWVIDGVEYSVPVTGRRVVVWPFGPNWSQPLTESLEWKTDVIKTFNGTEERRQLRSKPRRRLGYRITLHNNELNQFQNLIFGWQSRKFAVPIWQDKSVLQNRITIGGSIIPVETNTRSFFAGGLAILMTDSYTFEVFEIGQVNDDHLVSKKPLEMTWDRLTLLYPVNLAMLPVNVPTQRLTSKVMVCQVEFVSDPIQTDPVIPYEPAIETFDNHEVIYRKPNWSVPVQYDHGADVEILDHLTGDIQQVQNPGHPMQTRRVTWLLRDRDDIRDFRVMLGRRKGQLIPAYVPTWFQDFEVVGLNPQGSSAITVKRSQYDPLVGLTETQRHVLIRLRDGTKLIRKIIGTSKPDENTETLNLADTLPIDVTPGNTLMVSLVHLCRLVQDGVTINYQSDSVATVEMAMMTVKS